MSFTTGNLAVFLLSFAMLHKCETWMNFSQSVFDDRLLLEHLQSQIPKHFPPYDLQDRTVWLYIDILQITDIDEKKGSLELKMALDVFYVCPGAAWNKSDFGDGLLDIFFVPASTFWKPDIGKLKISKKSDTEH